MPSIRKTTVGQLLIDEALPPSMRGRNLSLTSKSVAALLQEVADKYPDQYVQVSKKLSDLGRHAATTSGGYSVGLEHLGRGPKTKAVFDQLSNELQQTYAQNLSDDEQAKRIVEIGVKYRQQTQDTLYDEAVAENNPLAMQILSGARGNRGNLASLAGSDLLYEDYKGRAIPMPILRSYSQGLSPAEAFAGSFGARRGLVDTKLSTAKSGFFLKQLNQIAHRLVVTALDADDPYDATNPRGMPVDTDNKYNSGSLLAHDVGGYARNTILTPKILNELRSNGHDKILIRSPIVGGPADGGVYSNDTGVREKGTLAPVGDFVGLSGAQALGEPLSQSMLSSKHCLAVGTLVRMADFSVKAIEDIRVGDWVLGADKTGRTFPVKVLQTFDNGARECVASEFQKAYTQSKDRASLVSTLDHKMLVIRRVSSSKQEILNDTPQVLPVGTNTGKISAIVPNAYDDLTTTRTHVPLAALVGSLLGDGCYTEAVNSVNFSCFDPSLVEDLEPTLAGSNLKLSRLKGHPGYYKVSMIVDKSRQDPATGQMLPGYRNPIKLWLDSRGMLGKYAHEKTLPPDVWNWNTESILAMIGGYFATDGSVYAVGKGRNKGDVRVSFGSTSLQMLQELEKLLLFRVGVHSVLHHGKPTKDRKRPMHYLVLSTQYAVKSLLAIMPMYGVKKATYEALKLNWKPKREMGPPIWRRTSQKPIGALSTYDIEVDHPDHLFVLANNLIVSNSGGVAGATSGSVGGFPLFNSMIQVPETFPGRASHAQVDGRVKSIKPADQGGHYVYVDNTEHYIPGDLQPSVKAGDMMEAGDVLSTGIPNPSEITQHKGIGEGRKYFVDTFVKAMEDSGTKVHRKNVELLSRGLINHVRLTEEHDDYSPDDLLPYQTLEARWQPRSGHAVVSPHQAQGWYLERPTLHYSVGTPIRPSVINNLKKFGVDKIYAHKSPPPFQAEMVRGLSSIHEDSDFMTRLLGSYQKDSLLEAAHHGAVSDTAGSSYVPALAQGKTFGRAGLTKAWDPADLKPIDPTPPPKLAPSLLDP